MRKRDLERHEKEAVTAWRLEKEARIRDLEEQIEWLRETNTDLLNRAMSQDWTQYTALSAIPQEPIEIPNRVWDPTGLIEVEVDDE